MGLDTETFFPPNKNGSQELLQGTDNVVPTGGRMPELAAEKLT